MGKRVYDFRKVMMEVEIDEFMEVDLRRPFGNAIHKNTDDIGIDELARAIFKQDTVEISDDDAKLLVFMLKNCKMQLVVAAQQALIRMLEGE